MTESWRMIHRGGVRVSLVKIDLEEFKDDNFS